MLANSRFYVIYKLTIYFILLVGNSIPKLALCSTFWGQPRILWAGPIVCLIPVRSTWIEVIWFAHILKNCPSYFRLFGWIHLRCWNKIRFDGASRLLSLSPPSANASASNVPECFNRPTSIAPRTKKISIRKAIVEIILAHPYPQCIRQHVSMSESDICALKVVFSNA